MHERLSRAVALLYPFSVRDAGADIKKQNKGNGTTEHGLIHP